MWILEVFDDVGIGRYLMMMMMI